MITQPPYLTGKCAILRVSFFPTMFFFLLHDKGLNLSSSQRKYRCSQSSSSSNNVHPSTKFANCHHIFSKTYIFLSIYRESTQMANLPSLALSNVQCMVCLFPSILIGTVLLLELLDNSTFCHFLLCYNQSAWVSHMSHPVTLPGHFLVHTRTLILCWLLKWPPKTALLGRSTYHGDLVKLHRSSDSENVAVNSDLNMDSWSDCGRQDTDYSMFFFSFFSG